MPLRRADWVILGSLLLCWPAQHLLDRLIGVTDANQRTKAINSLLVDVAEWPYTLAQWISLRRLVFPAFALLQKVLPLTFKMKDPTQGFVSTNESLAIEVINYQGAHVGNFAHSVVVRSPRPKEVKFRIGQVVEHKELGFRGVIVGWDPFAKAPETWLHKMYPKEHWRNQPNYLLLIDERDRYEYQRAYVPQESLAVTQTTKIKHPHLDNYFSHFDGGQYLPCSWLRMLYPHD